MLTSARSWGGNELVGDDLACRRGGRLVFAGLGFRIASGEALVLTGPNGSGKSSLLRLLATLLSPEDGQLLWQGRPVGEDPAAYRASMHYLGHLDATKPSLTASEMLAFWAALHGTAVPPVEPALAAFGLDHIADRPCRWLSAGQRRRLGLARLLAVPAPLWLLDEPGSALDSDSEERLVNLIAGHRAAGGMVVLTTHQPLAIADAASLRLDDYSVSAESALALAW